MDVQQRNRFLIASSIGVLLIIAVIAALMGRTRPVARDPGPVDITAPSDGIGLTAISLDSAPDDVRAAAKLLASSRVGYAIVKPDRTYLIISTGSDDLRVSLDRAAGQPAGAAATFVDIHLKADQAGERLLIATTELAAGVEYQFNVGDQYAAIPTLHNGHNLPLTHLDEEKGFSLLTPRPLDLIESATLRLEGYARVFEAQFMASVITEKGRVLTAVPVMAAAGAPSWGSFAAEIDLTGIILPGGGFLLLEEEMTGARLLIPLRFGQAQLG